MKHQIPEAWVCRKGLPGQNPPLDGNKSCLQALSSPVNTSSRRFINPVNTPLRSPLSFLSRLLSDPWKKKMYTVWPSWYRNTMRAQKPKHVKQYATQQPCFCTDSRPQCKSRTMDPRAGTLRDRLTQVLQATIDLMQSDMGVSKTQRPQNRLK